MTARRAAPGPAFGDDELETRVQAPARGRASAIAAAAPAPEELEAEDLVGEIVDGRYRVERLLGTGGMGAVYEAEHIEIGKKVALKVLHPQFSRQADLVQRFRREARAASKVGHPNIVDVTDSGTTERGDAYFVMERLDGTDLADVLRHERRVAVERTVAIGVQICRALHAAHQAGIIHRDLKPENIFLVARDGQPDFVKVLDFGIAKSESTAVAQPRRLTTPGIAMGTPEYMAPEQAAGKPVDARVDVYSVGAILYEMLVGDPPHAGQSIMDILAKKATEAPAPIRPRNKGVPEALERVILSALERDPAARPQTMAALEYELNKCVKGRGSAVAAVLGLKAVDDAPSWTDETGRSGGFEGGGASFPGSSRPHAATLHDVAQGAHDPPTREVELEGTIATAEPSRPSSLTRVLGILFGLAFLGGAGYLAYSYQQRSGRPLVPATAPPRAKAPNVEAPPRAPEPTATPTNPIEPTSPVPVPTEEDAPQLLEWAQRTLDGGRIVSPPGDNLKELLDRIDKASPGNPRAAELRTRATAALERRGQLALKRQRFEEAEDAYRALVVLRPDDDKAKALLVKTLRLRADRSLEKGRYTAALADASQALELVPDDVFSIMVQAEAHLATNKREQAQEEFRRVLELRPKNARAKKGLALAMSARPAGKKAGRGKRGR